MFFTGPSSVSGNTGTIALSTGTSAATGGTGTIALTTGSTAGFVDTREALCHCDRRTSMSWTYPLSLPFKSKLAYHYDSVPVLNTILLRGLGVSTDRGAAGAVSLLVGSANTGNGGSILLSSGPSSASTGGHVQLSSGVGSPAAAGAY